jgi:hypothetical protein
MNKGVSEKKIIYCPSWLEAKKLAFRFGIQVWRLENVINRPHFVSERQPINYPNSNKFLNIYLQLAKNNLI